MPCWTNQTAETDPGKMLAAPLIDALKAMGKNPRHDQAWIIKFDGGYFDIKAGTLHFKGLAAVQSESLTETIKTSYAAEVVKSQAKKFGWTLKETAKNQFEVIKR